MRETVDRLAAARHGNEVAGAPASDYERSRLDDLSRTLYADIRRIAAQRLRGDRASRSIGVTDLAHDVIERALTSDVAEGVSRAELLVRIARLSRQVLVDRARRRAALRHGGGRGFVQLEMDPTGARAFSPLDLVALDEALESLANLDARQARIVELRYFAGCTIAEVAATLEVSRSTIDKEERKARAFLALSLGGMAQ